MPIGGTGGNARTVVPRGANAPIMNSAKRVPECFFVGEAAGLQISRVFKSPVIAPVVVMANRERAFASAVAVRPR